MALSKSRIASLVSQLSSPNEAEAKSAASALDHLLYPPARSGYANQLLRLSEEFYLTIRGTEALDPLLSALQNGAEFARTYASQVLSSIKDRRALPLFLDALSAPSSVIRAAAVRGLWSFRDRSTVPALVHVLLHDSSVEVRHGAASALGFIGSAEAVPALTSFYENGDKDDRLAALHALGDICDPRSLPLVRAALFDRIRKIRKTAKSALFKYDLIRRGEWKRSE